MKEGNLPIDEIISRINYNNVYIRQYIDELFARKDLRDKRDISERDRKTLEKMLKRYNKITKYIEEQITKDSK